MKKVIHLHTDHKFIIDSERYEGEFFENQLIILDTKNKSNLQFHDTAIFLTLKEDNLEKILKIINKADMLVVYNLDFYKSLIVNKVGLHLKIIWRFFGNELYTRKLHLFLSRKSRSFVLPSILYWRIKSIFRPFFKEEKLFYDAVSRIDAITCVFEDEYNYLIKQWKHLPPFIPLSLGNRAYSKEIDFEQDYPKKKSNYYRQQQGLL